MKQVRLVATDLDGTLLDPSGCVSPRTAAAVTAVRATGIPVVPVTARPPQATLPFVSFAPLGPLALCSNGAVLVDTNTGEVLGVEEVKDAASVAQAVRASVPSCLLATDGLDGFVHEPGFFEIPVDWEEVLVEVPDICPVVAEGCITLVARAPGVAGPALVALLAEALAGVAQVTTAGVDWVFVTSVQATKALGVARACELLEVDAREVLAIGDNHNDLGFLAWAGLSMAPANAVEEVLAVVQRVLPGNDADGVAALLEELVQLKNSSVL